MDKPFDLTLALDVLGGDDELLQRISHMFVADYRERLDGLTRALAASDVDALFSSAHSLKGSASSFGAARAVTAAQALERCCRSKALDELGARVAELQVEITALADGLVAAGLAQPPEPGRAG